MSGNIIAQVSKFQNHLEEEDIKNILESEQDDMDMEESCEEETISYDDYEWGN